MNENKIVDKLESIAYGAWYSGALFTAGALCMVWPTAMELETLPMLLVGIGLCLFWPGIAGALLATLLMR